MLTEQQLNELNERLTSLQEQRIAVIDERIELQNFINDSLNHFLSQLASHEVKCSFDYNYDLDFSKEPYERIAYANISIKCIDDIRSSCFGYFDIKVYKDNAKPIEYSHASGSFKSTDSTYIYAVQLLSMLFNYEKKLREECFEMHDKFSELQETSWSLSSQIDEVNRILRQHQYECEMNEAIANLIEGQLYSDGAAKDWYLKVEKITNKTVKCKTYKDYSYYEEGNQYADLHYVSERTIKKDEFLRCLISGYYQKSDKEVL